mmetsp:Transcript_61997/g.164748  ORF Transcript_61997/g.164748 Transcript_61997/m.164748 type:complete len:234 (-) Transcript_61997:876-1577(-)
MQGQAMVLVPVVCLGPQAWKDQSRAGAAEPRVRAQAAGVRQRLVVGPTRLAADRYGRNFRGPAARAASEVVLSCPVDCPPWPTRASSVALRSTPWGLDIPFRRFQAEGEGTLTDQSGERYPGASHDHCQYLDPGDHRAAIECEENACGHRELEPQRERSPQDPATHGDGRSRRGRRRHPQWRSLTWTEKDLRRHCVRCASRCLYRPHDDAWLRAWPRSPPQFEKNTRLCQEAD